MPIRIPLCQIGVQRSGLTVYPKIGEEFSFTVEEVEEINAMQSKTGKKFFEKVIVPEKEVKDAKEVKDVKVPQKKVEEEL